MNIVDLIRSTPRCAVKPPAGMPVLAAGQTIPIDVAAFYAVCGGASLFHGEPYSLEIVPPTHFAKANPIIAGVEVPGDPSEDWYIFARNGEQFVSIDCGSKWNGRCYDSFWDRHAVAGSCPVVARSFSEFVRESLKRGGRGYYWLEHGFESLGDAYD